MSPSNSEKIEKFKAKADDLLQKDERPALVASLDCLKKKDSPLKIKKICPITQLRKPSP